MEWAKESVLIRFGLRDRGCERGTRCVERDTGDEFAPLETAPEVGELSRATARPDSPFDFAQGRHGRLSPLKPCRPVTLIHEQKE